MGHDGSPAERMTMHVKSDTFLCFESNLCRCLFSVCSSDDELEPTEGNFMSSLLYQSEKPFILSLKSRMLDRPSIKSSHMHSEKAHLPPGTFKCSQLSIFSSRFVKRLEALWSQKKLLMGCYICLK